MFCWGNPNLLDFNWVSCFLCFKYFIFVLVFILKIPFFSLMEQFSIPNVYLYLICESKLIVVKYFMYLMLIVYLIFSKFENGLSNWDTIDLLTDWCLWKCLFSWHFFFLLAYALICGGWVYDSVICGWDYKVSKLTL